MSSDADETPPPPDLGAGAERAWKHANAIGERIRQMVDELDNRVTARFEAVRIEIDTLDDQVDDRQDELVARMSKTEANVQELRGQDGRGGVVDGVRQAVTDLIAVRRQMTTQAISLIVIVLGAAFVLYSRVQSMETRLEFFTRSPPIWPQPVTNSPIPPAMPHP
jgi:hypothetical protein